MKGKFFNYTLIIAHSLTDVVEVKGKEDFHEISDRGNDESPSYDIKIVLGDLNTQICKEECYCPAIRKNSPHEVTNSNGDRMSCATQSCSTLVDSTVFKHKNIHRVNWW